MTLYRRPNTVGPDHFVIVHKESDGTTLGAWDGTSSITNAQDRRPQIGERAKRSKRQWPPLKACWESADMPFKWSK